MRPRWSLPAASLAALATLALVVACSGGSDDAGSTGVTDLSNIPTATAPAELPAPLILRDGDLTPSAGATTYTVQDGDSPSSIAEQFGISAEELMAANGITDPTSLSVGQVLTIPGSNVLGSTVEPTPAPATEEPVEPAPTQAAGGQTYIVQDGDIPETIAAQFGITADALMAANGITDPASLQIGQELIIPEPSQ